MIIKIVGKLPTANEYISASNRNRFVGAKMKKDATELVAWQCKGVPPIKGLNDYTFTWYAPNKRTDPDNRAYGTKFCLDGLQMAGVIANDSMAQINSICHFFALGDYRVDIEIKPA